MRSLSWGQTWDLSHPFCPAAPSCRRLSLSLSVFDKHADEVVNVNVVTMRIISFHHTWLNTLLRSSLCWGFVVFRALGTSLCCLGLGLGLRGPGGDCYIWCYPTRVGLPSHPSHAASPDLGWHQRVCTLFRQRVIEDTLCVHLASDYKVVSVGPFLHNSNEYLYLDLSLT